LALEKGETRSARVLIARTSSFNLAEFEESDPFFEAPLKVLHSAPEA
jgi:hypothetical protein